MDEVRQRDRRLLLEEVIRPSRSLLAIFALTLLFIINWPVGLGFSLPIVAWWVWSADQAAKKRHFLHPRFRIHWETSRDRVARLNTAMDQLKKSNIADLSELPGTIQNVALDLYGALRRADIVMAEISQSEGWLLSQAVMPPPIATDPQARALYDAAARSSKEYRDMVQGIHGGIERTEAQAAVFCATLDTLRVKMLSYRLVGRQVDTPSQDVLEALAEARMQLDSIDKALDELELTPFPKTIALTGEQAAELEDRA